MQLEDAIDRAIEAKLEAVHTSFPAIVQKYDGHDKRTCTIVPATTLMLSDGTILEALPIPNVPVIFPSSLAGGILFPIKKGDIVLAVVAESALGNFLAGDGAVPVDPEDPTRFTAHDAVCIPGLWPSLAVPTTKLGKKSGGMEFNNAVLEITSGERFKIYTPDMSAKTLLDDMWAELQGLTNDLATFANTFNPLLSPPPTVTPAQMFALFAPMQARLSSISTKASKVAQLLE